MKIVFPPRWCFIIVEHHKSYVNTAKINVENVISLNTELRTVESHVKDCKYQFW
jgi:hypothetical protein